MSAAGLWGSGVAVAGGAAIAAFSAFSVESLTLLERGRWVLAAAHTLADVLGALIRGAPGVMLARAVAG